MKNLNIVERRKFISFVNKYATIIFLFLLLGVRETIAQENVPLWKTLPEVPVLPKADDSGFASVNNIQMYYAVFNEKGSDPVLLLHGGLVSSDVWGFEVPLLIKKHKVIIADSRGHGRSTMSGQPLSYNLMASDVLQLMNNLNIKKASIVGWSDGGIIGLILAIKHPEKINKLFVFGTNFNSSGDKDEPVDSAMSAHFMAQAQANYRLHSPTPDSFFVLRKKLGAMYNKEPDLKPEEIKTITAPTVISGGEYDQFIKREHFEKLAQLIPNATLEIIPNVSHGGLLQDPLAFHKLVETFLDR
ncbi:MAG: alpha/beta hydrolase [Arachidicoccus sp.]|nr:alpha/beta hydrolase [Arachidicoccus sp.]